MLLDRLDELAQSRRTEVDEWFAREEGGNPPPFYASVDIRNAGYKVAVVDTNLFPAGFNNLCGYSYHLGAEHARNYIRQFHPGVKRLLVIPENATRNPGYTANVARLVQILKEAGLEVAVGSLLDTVPSSGFELEGLDDTKVLLERFQVEEGVPVVNGKPFDGVLLNHDLTGGEPELVRQLSVPVIPHKILGWHRRKKSLHFQHLQTEVDRFAEAFGLDPWELMAETDFVPEVDFAHTDPRLQETVERMLERTAAEFSRRGVDEKPYVFIKHDAGTYGMGVLPLYDPRDLEHLNRDMRKKMKRGKGGVPISDVIVQEGLPTRDRVRDCYGEPVIYAVNNRIIGGFFRMHCEGDERNSLNKPGQVFAHLCSTPSLEESKDEKCFHDSRLFRVYGILARLAGLAVMGERGQLEDAA